MVEHACVILDIARSVDIESNKRDGGWGSGLKIYYQYILFFCDPCYQVHIISTATLCKG